MANIQQPVPATPSNPRNGSPMNNVSLPLQEILRHIPSVEELLQSPALQPFTGRYPRKLVVESIRRTLEAKRQRLLAQPDRAAEVNLQTSHLVELILDRLETLNQYTLRPVVNATGIVIHTNLGRSLLPIPATERLQILARSYNNLEYDLEQGRRGSRTVHAEAILCEITGAEAALVVNNNAAAVFLVLQTLAKDREVIVSRGQLVEIGGSFRIPDVMVSSGAALCEVGCTNRTHLRDYESAINERTALLMKVHSSNYRIIGFTAEVPLEQLVTLGQRHGLPVVEDLGSGSFCDLSRFGLEREPTAQEAIAKGADVVTFSGDKLLGGPQAGIILGRKELVARFKKNPLTRALRVDKLTLAALEATLRLYRDETQALELIPTLRMISMPLALLEEQAQSLAEQLRTVDSAGKLQITVQPGSSQVGGGSLPAQDLPTRVVALHSSLMSTPQLEQQLRASNPPVIARIEADQVLLDVRTLQEGDFNRIAQALAGIVSLCPNEVPG
jgi:L-seryl-tRNA(Ser) seleniumtransferase